MSTWKLIKTGVLFGGMVAVGVILVAAILMVLLNIILVHFGLPPVDIKTAFVILLIRSLFFYNPMINGRGK